jgi:hypothetical protein
MSGNVMDTFRVAFDDGTDVYFIARDFEHAILTAKELYNISTIVMIERIGEWEDDA